MKICIVGSGTYGSYIAKCISDKSPEYHISIFEVGNSLVKSEKQIGFLSRIFGNKYEGLSKGRYFGIGGTSNKWGGQILTFSNLDFKNPNTFLKDIIQLNIKYKTKIHNRLGIPIPPIDVNIDDDLIIKSGVWISVFKRNLFKLLKIKYLPNLKLIQNTRIIKLNKINSKSFSGIEYLRRGIIYHEKFDFVFLACGAFESARILLSSGMIDDNKIYFSDHLSKEFCLVKGSTNISKTNFIFKIKGLSLLTKRIIGEENGISFYLHPVYNLKFKFFEYVKVLLFYKNFHFKNIYSLIKYSILEFPLVVRFLLSILVKKKMFVKDNEWSFYLDIENPNFQNSLSLSDEKDSMGISSLVVEYKIQDFTKDYLVNIESRLDNYLSKSHVEYLKYDDSLNEQTYEDIYHPFGMYYFKDIKDYYNRWNGLLILNTGILPRAGGINPTAAVFPIIEDFIDNYLP
jgi:hypothetical protein